MAKKKFNIDLTEKTSQSVDEDVFLINDSAETDITKKTKYIKGSNIGKIDRKTGVTDAQKQLLLKINSDGNIDYTNIYYASSLEELKTLLLDFYSKTIIISKVIQFQMLGDIEVKCTARIISSCPIIIANSINFTNTSNHTAALYFDCRVEAPFSKTVTASNDLSLYIKELKGDCQWTGEAAYNFNIKVSTLVSGTNTTTNATFTTNDNTYWSPILKYHTDLINQNADPNFQHLTSEQVERVENSLQSTDRILEFGATDTPTNDTADGGGITLLGATNKTITWVKSKLSWVFNQAVEIAGNLNVIGIIKTNGSQISTSDLSDGSDVVKNTGTSTNNAIAKFSDTTGKLIGNSNVFMDNFGRIGINIEPDPRAMFSYLSTQPLGSVINDVVLLSSRQSTAVNKVKNNVWSRRWTDTYTNWESTALHDAISIDTSFMTPGTDTRTWYERRPKTGEHIFGHAALAYLRLSPTEITTPLEINGRNIAEDGAKLDSIINASGGNFTNIVRNIDGTTLNEEITLFTVPSDRTALLNDVLLFVSQSDGYTAAGELTIYFTPKATGSETSSSISAFGNPSGDSKQTISTVISEGSTVRLKVTTAIQATTSNIICKTDIIY